MDKRFPTYRGTSDWPTTASWSLSACEEIDGDLVVTSERSLRDVNQPVMAFFPDRSLAGLDARKKETRFEDLLTMQSGYIRAIIVTSDDILAGHFRVPFYPLNRRWICLELSGSVCSKNKLNSDGSARVAFGSKRFVSLKGGV